MLPPLTSRVASVLAGASSPVRSSLAAAPAPAPAGPRSVIRGQLIGSGSVSSPVVPELWAVDKALVGSVGFDWATLTTSDYKAFTWATRILQAKALSYDLKSAKTMQYEGCQSKAGGYFFGTGIQNGAKHHMVRISGAVAQLFLLEAVQAPEMLTKFKATRLDLQYTHNEVPAQSLYAIREHLFDAEWTNHKGKMPGMEVRSDKNKRETLYIGSRSSVRLQRLYIKPIGATDHLRWETEYKGELAQKLLEMLVVTKMENIASILGGEMAQIPLKPFVPAIYEAVRAEPERLKLTRTKSDVITSAEWLLNSAVPCYRRLQRYERATNDKVMAAHLDFFKAALELDTVEIPEADYLFELALQEAAEQENDS